MTSTEDILSAIEWLNANDCPEESEPLLRVADMLQGIVTQRYRAKVRRLMVEKCDTLHPGQKNTPQGKAWIRRATDKAMEAWATRVQS